MKQLITSKEFRNMKAKKPNKKEEESLQIRVAEYLRTKHTNLIFISDFSAGCKLTMGQAIRNKRMQCGEKMPDIFVAEPVTTFASLYHGMYLELKKSTEGVYLKDGSLSKNEHIQSQSKCHKRLRDKGYYCEFACGYENAIFQIENYLKGIEMIDGKYLAN